MTLDAAAPSPSVEVVEQAGRYFVTLDGVRIAWRNRRHLADEFADELRAHPRAAAEVYRIANGWRTAPGLSETARLCREEAANG